MPFKVRYSEIDALVRQLTEKAIGIDPEIVALLEASAAAQAETLRLSRALRVGAVAHDRAGERTLRGVLKAAGLGGRFDFQEQFGVESGEPRLRPDVRVEVSGCVFVIDAKCSLNAFLEAQEATDGAQRDSALARHAEAVRFHMLALGAEAYWKQFTSADLPDFVAMFLPGDRFLAAALQRLPDLMAEAAEKNVVLVTPTTLLALGRALTEERKVETGAAGAVKLAATEALAAREKDRAEKLARMDAILAEFDKMPRTGLKADKAFFDSLNDE